MSRTHILRWAGVVLAFLVPTQNLSAGVVAARASSVIHSANPCRHSTTLSAGATIGSQVDGQLVTICLSKSLIRKLKPKPAPRPVPKPTLRVKPIPVARPTPKPTRVLVAAPARPRPITRPHPLPKKPPRATATDRGNRGVFKPTVDPVSATPQIVRPGTRVLISSAQKTRLGRTKLLGSPVVVRFTPLRLHFDLGDGESRLIEAPATSFPQIYSKPGTYNVHLGVTYLVEYRLSSGRWYRDPDTIQLWAPSVQIKVRDNPESAMSGNIVLVTP